MTSYNEDTGKSRMSETEWQPDLRAEYLKGVTKDRLTILDAKKVLADKNLIVHQEVMG